MTTPAPENNPKQDKLIEQIIEVEREFYFENKGKESERRRRLRDLIDLYMKSENS